MNVIQEVVEKQDVGHLCRFFFEIDPTLSQQKIIRTIAFKLHKRISVNCMTRFGKSISCSMAILLFALFYPNSKNAIVAPTYKQCRIIMEYIGSLVLINPVFRSFVDLDTTGLERLKKEVSKDRITFKNGSEIRILSAEGKGERLMGFGVKGCLIVDESCLISHEVFRSKILRMLGDDPDNIFVDISNPWHRDNHCYQNHVDPNFFKIHVGWKTALQEGRITEVQLAEFKSKVNPVEWTVLYESNFPEESDDQLIKYGWIRSAVDRWVDMPEAENILSVDVGDQGKDFSVLINGRTKGGLYMVTNIYFEGKSETVPLVGKIISNQQQNNVCKIMVDCIGVGVGVVSLLKEQLPVKTCQVISCHFGMQAKDHNRFLNQKAEQYFRLAKLFEEGRISIPDNERLIKDLISLKWEHTSSGKVKIKDPEDRSLDWACSLCYLCWESSSSRTFHIA